jgi:hypothetical protein
MLLLLVDGDAGRPGVYPAIGFRWANPVQGGTEPNG